MLLTIRHQARVHTHVAMLHVACLLCMLASVDVVLRCMVLLVTALALWLVEMFKALLLLPRKIWIKPSLLPGNKSPSLPMLNSSLLLARLPENPLLTLLLQYLSTSTTLLLLPPLVQMLVLNKTL